MNTIITNDFSNPKTKELYKSKNWIENQCGGCSFFAPLNQDFGLCCLKKSVHFKETVFEHYGCDTQVNEGWGPHSFSENEEDHCKCENE